MELDLLLKEYSNNKELKKQLSLDEDNLCHLLINENTRVTLERSIGADHFFLYGIIGTVPKEKTEAVLTDALQANLFDRETGNASLGLDDRNNALVLFEKFEESTTDYSIFEEHLEAFLTIIQNWRKRLKTKKFIEHSLDTEIKSLQGKQNLQIFIA